MPLFTSARIAWCFFELVKLENKVSNSMLIWLYVYQNRDKKALIAELLNRIDKLSGIEEIYTINTFLQNQDIDKSMSHNIRFKRFVFWQIIIHCPLIVSPVPDAAQLEKFLSQHFELEDTAIFDDIIENANLQEPSGFFTRSLYKPGITSTNWRASQDMGYLLQVCYLGHINKTPTQIFLELYIKTIKHCDWHFTPELVLVYNAYYNQSHPLHTAHNISIIKEVIEQFITRDNIFGKNLTVGKNRSIICDIKYLATILQEPQHDPENQAPFDLDNCLKHYEDYIKRVSRSANEAEEYRPEIRVTEAQKDFMCSHYSRKENQTKLAQSIFGKHRDECLHAENVKLKSVCVKAQSPYPIALEDMVEPHSISDITHGDARPNPVDIPVIPRSDLPANKPSMMLAVPLFIGVAICAIIIYRFRSTFFTGAAQSQHLMGNNDITPTL